MAIPVNGRSMLRRATVLCAVLAAMAYHQAAAATVDVRPGALPPPIRIAMEPMGFQQPSGGFLLRGGSGLTVDFVDNDHVLLTFQSHGVIKRAADEQPGDDDHMVEALLLELPTGKVLARTEWRLHDTLQYLWNIGHGRFLLRVRDKLTMLAPLERLASGDAFRGTPVLDLSSNGNSRHIVALILSSNEDLLTLETTQQQQAPDGAESHVSFSGGESAVQINFYRLDIVPDGFHAQLAGIVHAQEPIKVPMTRAGILDILPDGKNRWLFNFNEHAGKVDELAEWDTTCFPRATFVSHSEFVAFGCRGSDDAPEIAGFNMKGEEMWEQRLYENFVSPGNFAFAPSAGRFVLERTLVNGDIDSSFGLTQALAGGEEVRVYQTETGKILLKVNVLPVERAGGNFALSPDGMRLATFDQTSQRKTSRIGDTYMETLTSLVVYPLPPLSVKVRAQIDQMEANAPADNGARIDAALMRIGREQQAGAASQAPKLPVAAAVVNPEASSNSGDVSVNTAPADEKEPGNPALMGQLPDAPGLGAAANVSDEEQSGQHGPPTLYQPGETPQTAPRKKPE